MIDYLAKHILEEIDGALDYMEKAVEHKSSSCGKIFYLMAKQELDHANHLYKMFSAEEKPASMTDAQYSAAMKSVVDKYSEGMTKIEAMKHMLINL